jgi:DNA polymerase-3 subunit alpha
MEAYVTKGQRRERTRDSAHHLVLLARDERGFRNLMKLSSLAFLEGFYYKPRVDHELLAANAEGLLALSACPKGEIGSAILDDDEEEAFRTAGRYREIFGAENFFLEIQNHGLEIEDKIRARVTALAARTGIPLVATNDCHYLRHEDADAHDVLLCIQTGDGRRPLRLRYATKQLYPLRRRDAPRFPTPGALHSRAAVAGRCNLRWTSATAAAAFPLPAGPGPPRHLRVTPRRSVPTRRRARQCGSARGV